MSRPSLRQLIATTASAIAVGAVIAAPAGANGTGNDKPSSVKVKGGATTVTLNADTAGVLFGTDEGQFGLTPGVVQPATANLDKLKLRFPVTKGTAKVVAGKRLQLVGGKIRHSGGITLSSDSASLKLTKFFINVKRGKLTAKVNGGPRVPILALGGDIETRVKGKRVIVSGVELTVTPQTIGALNDTFGAGLPADAEIPFGTAKVSTRVR